MNYLSMTSNPTVMSTKAAWHVPMNNANRLLFFAGMFQVLIHFVTKLSTQHVVQCDIDIIAIFAQKLYSGNTKFRGETI